MDHIEPMRSFSFLAVAFFLLAVVTAASSRMAPGYVAPEPAVIVVVFVALRREPIMVAVISLSVGYMLGRQAAAPLGLHETTMVASGVAAYIASGRLAAGGALFFAVLCGFMTMASQLLAALLLQWGMGHVGFSSQATMLLLPQALLTSVLALVLYRSLDWLDARFSNDTHEELPWS